MPCRYKFNNTIMENIIMENTIMGEIISRSHGFFQKVATEDLEEAEKFKEASKNTLKL